MAKELDELWKANVGSEILFIWFNFLTEDSLKFLQAAERPGFDFFNFAKCLVCDNRLTPGGSRAPSIEGCPDFLSLYPLCPDCPKYFGELDSRCIQDSGSCRWLRKMFVNFSGRMRQEEFDSTVYPCEICFADKGGLDCVEFVGCGHVYCKSCLRDYFGLLIREGSVRSLKCPHQKCDTDILPEQVCNKFGTF